MQDTRRIFLSVWASNLQSRYRCSSGIRHCSPKRHFLKKPTSADLLEQALHFTTKYA